MMTQVQCVVLGEKADALDTPPYPGLLGQRIFESVSREGWKKWLERQVLIINENQLSSADPQAIEVLEQHMLGFFFGEGDMGDIPQGFAPRKK
ncbi:MAG: oxidative damage protection protein [Acidiferrobacteraceae bacterium]|nr:oxidative damage protection protein [Acidiferrobacteraceae bacterium]MCP4828230.1 oxidative damage protection protein [Pseudomonadota bacterium]